MPIIAKEEIIQPAKTYNKLWARKIDITVKSPTDAYAQVILIPYNDQDEYCEDKPVYLAFNNIYEYAVQNPESNIAKAMYFLLASINEKYQEENV